MNNVVHNIGNVRFEDCTAAVQCKLKEVGRPNCQFLGMDGEWTDCDARWGSHFHMEDIYRTKPVKKARETSNKTQGVSGCMENTYDHAMASDQIIFSRPATIVKWADGTKTVVKTMDGDKFDPVTGYLHAYFMKQSGMTRTQVNKKLKDITEEWKSQEIDALGLEFTKEEK